MEKEERKLPPVFTEIELESIMWEDGLWDENEENKIFSTINKKIISTDQEKNSVQKQFTIQHIESGRYFSATLGESPWYMQGEYNAKQPWYEVFPKKKEITVFE